MLRREIGGERKASCLRCVQTSAGQQECERCRTGAGRFGIGAAHQQQRERHDREAAELQQRAEPQIGHAPPAEQRAVMVGAMADQRARWREQQGQGNHRGNEPGGDAELDDHHAVERAGQQHRRHAHADLEQRQPDEPAERQLRAGGVGKGQPGRCDPGPEWGRRRARRHQPRTSSIAREV
jgi:hypothetical protein